MNNTKNNALLFRANRSAQFGDNAYIEDEIYVTDDECTPASGSLAEGMLDGNVVNAVCISPRSTCGLVK